VLALATWAESLIIVGGAVGALLLLWGLWRLLRSRIPEQVRSLVDQLIPVVVIAGIAMSILVAIDREQADLLVDGVARFVPVVLVAVIIVILARALGRILGLFVETALRGVSPVIASRGRIGVSSLILGIGAIIAMQVLGLSADIILLLVGALAFGTALALALAFGHGAVPLARQVAAGRHVKDRFEAGQLVRVDEVEGRIASIGLASTRIAAMDGGFVEVPNDAFLGGSVLILG
jgi:small-conductance mechanosensitive channel